jgi:hypothetical protein
MTVKEFIQHLSTSCSLNGLDPDDTEIEFLFKEYRILDPDDITFERNEEGDFVLCAKFN